MCILFIALKQHPDYPLIIAANRDEFHARPSTPMHYWQDQPRILAGRDNLANGTWLGLERDGGFCAVTNFSGGDHNPKAKSRGELIANYLTSDQDSSNFTAQLTSNCQNYNPFNLVYGNAASLTVFSSVTQTTQTLNDGFHSISNGHLDQIWPKMSSGISRLKQAITKQNTNKQSEFKERLINIMQHEGRANTIPDNAPNNSVEILTEQKTSSIFIRGENYGTRATTIVLFGHTEILVSETNYDCCGGVVQTVEFELGR